MRRDTPQNRQQIGERLAIQVFDRSNDRCALCGVSEGLGEPVELFNNASPGQWLPLSALVTVLSLCEFTAIPSPKPDPAAECFGIQRLDAAAPVEDLVVAVLAKLSTL
jgi:hypothetical protein